MSAVAHWFVVAVLNGLTLLIAWALLPGERLLHPHTMVSGAVSVCAWFGAGIVITQLRQQRSTSASVLFEWPIALAMLGWAVFAGVSMTFAADLSTRVLVAVHGVAAGVVALLAIALRVGGAHAVDVERAIDATD